MAWNVTFGGNNSPYGGMMPTRLNNNINYPMTGYEVMPNPLPQWNQPTAPPSQQQVAATSGNIWTAIAQAIAQAQQARAASRPSLQSLSRMDYIRGGGDEASGVGFSDALRSDADRIYERSRRNATPNIWDQILAVAGPAAGVYGAGQQSGWKWR